MARDFIPVDRGQLLLMPPSLNEWLPEDHLVWTVLGAVEVMDLSRFNDSYRLGGVGRAPYDPQMLVALLLYAYARGNRSSRGIERACQEDVAFKVITSMHTPDHSTIAEFRRRHETDIAELFNDVLGLCREAGLVSVGVITIDGTKIKANASMDQNRTYSGVVNDILREAEDTDQREDELYGDKRGDELPEQLRNPDTRRQATRRSWRSTWRRRCSIGRCSSAAAGSNGCGSRARSWKLTAPARARRFRVIVMIGCSARWSGWRRTTRLTFPRSRPMNAGA